MWFRPEVMGADRNFSSNRTSPKNRFKKSLNWLGKNKQNKKYNWIDFMKDAGVDSQLRVTPAITEHVEELWGREFDAKKDCLMEVLVPAGVVAECKEGAKRWLKGERPLPGRARKSAAQ